MIVDQGLARGTPQLYQRYAWWLRIEFVSSVLLRLVFHTDLASGKSLPTVKEHISSSGPENTCMQIRVISSLLLATKITYCARHGME